MGNKLSSVGGRYFGTSEGYATFKLGSVVLAEDVEDDDEFDDPVERMLKKTGCIEKHYAVQECIAETKDWRQCQKVVQDFRDCMDKFKKSTSSSK